MASRDLLEDDDVRRWFENLRRGSWATADKNLRILARYCRWTETTPSRIIETYQEDRQAVRDGFLDFIEKERKKGRAASYLREYGNVLSSWVRHHGLRWPRGIRYGNTNATPTLEGERVPSKEELRGVLHRASSRGRVVVALVAFAGLRFEVMGDAQGLDGLRVKDLLDFRLERTPDGLRVRVDHAPAFIKVRWNLSKTKRLYLAPLAPEGCEILRTHLQGRLDAGEELTPETAVVRVNPGYEDAGKRADAPNRGSEFLVSQNVRREVRRAFGASLRQRPYVLRSYFSTALLLADAKVGVPKEFRDFWMGHAGTMSNRYNTNKGVLPPEVLEAMREAYGRAEPFLSTLPVPSRLPTTSMAELAADFVQNPARLIELAEEMKRLGTFESAQAGLKKSVGS